MTLQHNYLRQDLIIENLVNQSGRLVSISGNSGMLTPGPTTQELTGYLQSEIVALSASLDIKANVSDISASYTLLSTTALLTGNLYNLIQSTSGQGGSGSISGAYVSHVNGLSGDVNFYAGYGLALSGTTYSVTGSFGDATLRTDVQNATGNLQSQITSIQGVTGTFALDANVVHRSGDETLLGFVTISGGLSSPKGSATSQRLGMRALTVNTGTYNTAIGTYALELNTSGNVNTAVGGYTMPVNTIGRNNTAIGSQAMWSSISGDSNTGVGYRSLYKNVDGSYNTAIGYQTGNDMISGSNNVFIGRNAGLTEQGSNRLHINATNLSAPTSADALIYGEFDTGRVFIKGVRIATSADISGYTLSSTTALLTGNLQNQITAVTNNISAISGALNNYTLLTTTSAISSGLNTRVSNLETIVTKTSEPRGFENTTDSSIMFSDSTRTFNISGNYYIWQNGIRYAKTGESQQLPNTTATYYLYYDANANFGYSTTPWEILTGVPIAIIYWNATDGKGILNNERHGIIMDSVTHKYLHETIGSKIDYAGALDSFILTQATTTSAGQQFGIGSSSFFDEDINTVTSPKVSGGPYTIIYKEGTGTDWRISTNNGFPYKIGTYIQYNQLSGSTWVMSDMSVNNSYVNYYLMVTSAVSGAYQNILIPGQTTYTTLALAQGETISSVNFNGIPFVEFCVIYRLTYKYSTQANQAATFRGNLQAVASVNSNLILQGITPANTHNALSGLQGGSPGEYYHLTSTEHDDIIGASTVASLSGNLQSQITSIQSLTGSYTLLSTTALLTGNLQSQITSIESLTGSYALTSTVASLTGNLQSQITSIQGVTGTFALNANVVHKTGSETISGIKTFYNNITSPTNSSGFGNERFGDNSLNKITTGSKNTAFGYYALFKNDTGSYNVAVGGSAGVAITTGTYNTIVGTEALYSNDVGQSNTAIGFQTMQNATSGNNNTALGFQALFGNVTGSNNLAVGYAAGGTTMAALNNTTLIGTSTTVLTDGLTNATALGYAAQVSASNQLVLGNASVTSFKTGAGADIVTSSNISSYIPASSGSSSSGVFTGDITANSVTIGRGNGSVSTNTAVGFAALASANSNGTGNTAVGYQAMNKNTGAGGASTSGLWNTAVGYNALLSMVGSSLGQAISNTAVGNSSLNAVTTGTSNTAIGKDSGTVLQTGSSNTFLGAAATTSSTSISNSTAIGASSTVGTSNTMVFGASTVTSFKTGAGADIVTSSNIGSYAAAADIAVIFASENLSAGDFVSLWNNAETPNVRRAIASVSNKPAHGFVLSSVSASGNATVYFSGTNNQCTALSGGLDMFLSTSAGQPTATVTMSSGYVVQYLGQRLSSTIINVKIDRPITVA